jgi:DNA-binding transcriptional regulator YdaS (Cro superfamily)
MLYCVPMDIKTAINQFEGGQVALARRLGISSQAIGQWVNGHRPIPARFCPLLESLLGITCGELRPDLMWTRNDAGEITGYHVRLSAA